MSSSRWAATPIGRLVIAAAIAGLAGGVTACDAGNNAPTLEFHPQSVGVDTAVHGIQIIDAFVLGAPNGSLAAGQSAGLFVAFYNQGRSADRLIGVTASGVAKSVLLSGGATGVSLPVKQAVDLTGPKPVLVLSGLLHALAAGTTVHVTFSFENAGSVTLDLPVLQRADEYATFAPAPSPTPSASTTTKTSTKAHATGSPSPGTSTSTSPTPTPSTTAP
ncbi:MAG: copper chaperone PCu(A)C [Streptosporangiaceae bacterium]